jgi:hypothetical protein
VVRGLRLRTSVRADTTTVSEVSSMFAAAAGCSLLASWSTFGHLLDASRGHPG